jgi:inosose dehydratase
MVLTRRQFIATSLASAAVAACSRAVVVASRRRANLKFGYASITWGTNDLLAMQQISELGYAGIQMRANIVNQFVRNPPTLSNLLAEKHLTFVALSSGPLAIEGVDEARMLGEHAGRAKFLHDAGGLYLQVTDERPRDRAVTSADCKKLGELLTEVGKRAAEVGVTVAYHPHMGTIGEKPEDTDRILAAADEKYVKLLLDVAHYFQGGGDPAAAIRRYGNRLALLHLKDVEQVATGQGYRFVELGQGRVNLPAVFDALGEIGYNGWAVVELDATTAPGRSAKESAEINKKYLTARGYSVG